MNHKGLVRVFFASGFSCLLGLMFFSVVICFEMVFDGKVVMMFEGQHLIGE